MTRKNFLTLAAIFVLLNSCADSFDSVKRGLTGAKSKSTDEFLVKKKDPLVLPPDFESLPTPDESPVLEEVEVSSFEKKLKNTQLTENDAESTSSEASIL